MKEIEARDKPARKAFNKNYIGLALLVVAYLLSLLDILRPEATRGEEPVDERKIVRVLHWQLEPGFREALDAVIADYNALPHVREAGYKVQQMAVTERVYSQFLNVHLISGTAPDLATLGQAKLDKSKAMFFEPYGKELEEPNPYNQADFLPDDIDPELQEFLSQSSWKETFPDGLKGSLDGNMGYYYSVPAVSAGTVRLFWNKSLLKRVKNVLLEGISGDQPAAWVARLISANPSATESAMLPDSPALRDWIRSEEPPQSFGQLILLSEAVGEYGRLNGLDKLVAIAGSSYSGDRFKGAYNTPLFYAWEDLLDTNRDGAINNLELYAGYANGKWDFQHPRFRAYIELQRMLGSYFPAGFLGLDREQANRRFILGNALFLATGIWDAAGIYIGASEKADPSEQFEVGVMNFPLPKKGERWGEFEPKPAMEWTGGSGVQLALYKFSRHKDEAIDFLRYLTSAKANGKMARMSGWLPAIIGPEPRENMKPFVPNINGVAPSLELRFQGGNVQTIANGQYFLLISGDISYQEYSRNLAAALEDSRNGLRRQWFEAFRSRRDFNRALERSLSLQRFHQLLQNDLEHEKTRYSPILHRSANGLGGLLLKREWKLTGSTEPFPEF